MINIVCTGENAKFSPVFWDNDFCIAHGNLVELPFAGINGPCDSPVSWNILDSLGIPETSFGDCNCC